MKNDAPPTRILDRIFTRLDVADCWEWTGALASGYGRISWSLGHREMRWGAVHRIVFTFLAGSIPDDMDLDHLCRNRKCANPDHLQPVDRQTNLLRGETVPAKRASQTHCRRGHPLSGDNMYYDKLGRRNCRECGRISARSWHERNRARRSAYNKEWRAKRQRASAQESA